MYGRFILRQVSAVDKYGPTQSTVSNKAPNVATAIIAMHIHLANALFSIRITPITRSKMIVIAGTT